MAFQKKGLHTAPMLSTCTYRGKWNEWQANWDWCYLFRFHTIQSKLLDLISMLCVLAFFHSVGAPI